MLVADLINLETNSWRFELLDELFDVVSRAAISNIVIPMIPRPDKLTWIANPKGVFSVKSVHRIDLNHLWPAKPDSTWQKFWKCNLHERLKTLIWRIGSGVLPTNLNVHFRLSKGNPCCPLCNSEAKSIPYLFFNCQATKLFRFSACWDLRPESLLVYNDFDVVKLVVNPLFIPQPTSIKNQEVVHASIQMALTLEAIWNFRNNQDKAVNPIVALKALEFRVVEHVQAILGDSSSVTLKELYWRPPPLGIIKLNVDATILHEAAKIAVVAIFLKLGQN